MAPLQQRSMLYARNFTMEVRVTSVNIKFVHVPMLKFRSVFFF